VNPYEVGTLPVPVGPPEMARCALTATPLPIRVPGPRFRRATGTEMASRTAFAASLTDLEALRPPQAGNRLPNGRPRRSGSPS